MAAEYQVVLYSPSGIKQAQITNFYDLTYTNRRNSVGICQFELDYDIPLATSITDRWFVEVYRRNAVQGVDWYCDFYGIVRSVEKKLESGRMRVAVKAYSLLHLLEWRIIAYCADTEGQSRFSSCPSDKIMKDLVRYNATASATTAEGRARDGEIRTASITIQPGNTSGSIVSWSGAWEILLPNLQQLADVGGGDFDLIKTASTTYDFRFYANQRGVDRSESFQFSSTYDNMSNVSFLLDRSDEKTVAIVGGRGQSASRSVLVLTGSSYGASNDIEVFVNATGGCTITYYIDTACAELVDRKAGYKLSFTPVQTSNTYYGLNYTWGDKVKATFEGTSVCMLVDAVTVSVDQDGSEGIEVELKEV